MEKFRIVGRQSSLFPNKIIWTIQERYLFFFWKTCPIHTILKKNMNIITAQEILYGDGKAKLEDLLPFLQTDTFHSSSFFELIINDYYEKVGIKKKFRKEDLGIFDCPLYP